MKNLLIGDKMAMVGDGVHIIGEIDRNIYKVVSDCIVTDDVIITDERIQHIMERHPNDYERMKHYLHEVVREPDYILEDKKPDTGIILKYIEHNGLRLQIVLKLQTIHSRMGYENSIISAWIISKERWNNYLRNKKILYSRE